MLILYIFRIRSEFTCLAYIVSRLPVEVTCRSRRALEIFTKRTTVRPFLLLTDMRKQYQTNLSGNANWNYLWTDQTGCSRFNRLIPRIGDTVSFFRWPFLSLSSPPDDRSDSQGGRFGRVIGVSCGVSFQSWRSRRFKNGELAPKNRVFGSVDWRALGGGCVGRRTGGGEGNSIHLPRTWKKFNLEIIENSPKFQDEKELMKGSGIMGNSSLSKSQN